MLWVLPCWLACSFILMIGSVIQVLGLCTACDSYLLQIYAALNVFIPLLMACSIGYMLAIHYHLSRPICAFISLILAAIPHITIEIFSSGLEPFLIIISIVTPFYSIAFIAFIKKFKWSRIAKTDIAQYNVKDALNMIIPALLATVLVMSLSLICVSLPALVIEQLGGFFELTQGSSPLLDGLIFTSLNSGLWFFGIHGYHALTPLVEYFDEALVLNHALVSAGDFAEFPVNLSFLGAFVFIGGSGATLSLIIAVLLFCKNKSFRLIAIASVPIGLFNVNELLLFGLPIILNFRLFIPFLILPAVNLAVALLATQFGLVDPAIHRVPFNSPVVLNALLATGFDPMAVVLQVFNLAVGVMVYKHFICAIDRHSLSRNTVYLKSLETTFSRFQEEAYINLNFSRIEKANQHARDSTDVFEKIKLLGRQEFVLEYQPQVSSFNNRVTGCEALVRVVNDDGKLVSPEEFLPWMRKANLMVELDLWVLRKTVVQIKKWQERYGSALPVSVNITAESLQSTETVERIIALLEQVRGLITLELTEQSLAGDAAVVTSSLQKFRAAGAKVYIDDFGTGYSSLSYLHRFEIDAIKIDRSFVLALETKKGVKVFNSLLNLVDMMNIHAVIEGVETDAQMNFLRELNGVTIQGWYYSKSLSADGLIDYVAEHSVQAEKQLQI